MQRTRKMSRNNKTSIFSRFNADKKKTLVMPTRSCLTFDPRFTETSCLFSTLQKPIMWAKWVKWATGGGSKSNADTPTSRHFLMTFELLCIDCTPAVPFQFSIHS